MDNRRALPESPRVDEIRKLRQSTKKLLDDLAPVISRLITPINARVGSAAPAPKEGAAPPCAADSDSAICIFSHKPEPHRQ